MAETGSVLDSATGAQCLQRIGTVSDLVSELGIYRIDIHLCDMLAHNSIVSFQSAPSWSILLSTGDAYTQKK